MEKIISLPLSDNLVERVAEYIVKEYGGKDLSRVAVVFEGRRPGLFLRRELSQRMGKSFFPPAIFSIDDFIRDTAMKATGYGLVSDIDAAYLIYRLAQRTAPEIVSGRETFARFMPWAHEIRSFFDQIDSEKVPDHLLISVQKNADIGYDVPEGINTLLRHLSVIRTEYHAALRSKKLMSRGLMYREAGEQAKSQPFEAFDQVLFCGLFYMNRSEEDITANLYERGKATLFFTGDQSRWPVLERVARRFKATLTPKRLEQPSPKISMYAGYDIHSQVAVAREIVKIDADRERTAVILPESETLIPLVSDLAAVVDDLNVSLGYPLSRSSLHSLLEYIFKAQGSRREKEYYAADYIRAITHPLVKNIRLPLAPAVTRVLVHKIEEALSGAVESPLAGTLFVKLDDIEGSHAIFDAAYDTLRSMDPGVRRDQLQDTVCRFHRLLFSSWENIPTFAGLGKTLSSTVQTLVDTSFLAAYPLNISAAESLLGIADEFARSSFADEPFAPEDVFKIVADRMAGEKVSFSGTPLKGLQVLGFLESRALSFEKVIILDLNEPILPHVTISEPLIPREVLLGLGLTRVEKEEEIQRYHFMRLLAAARDVHLVYSLEEKKEKSRFIEELLWERQKASKKLDVMPVKRARYDVQVAPDKLPKPKDGEVLSYLNQMNYSSTRVNMYLDCPMRFYFHYLLGLREKEEISDAVEGAEIGIFVHRVLDTVFTPFVGQKPEFTAAFRDRFFKILNDEFRASFNSRMKADAFLVKEVIDYRMEQFLEAERARPVRRIISLEKSLFAPLTLNGRTYPFEARLDRIDELEDGTIAVLDYKTGSTPVMPARLQTLTNMAFDRAAIKRAVVSFQLPLYVMLAQGQFPGARVDAALYDLRTAELKSFFRDDSDADRETRQAACVKALGAMVAEITNPDVPFVADESLRERCASCPYFYACR